MLFVVLVKAFSSAKSRLSCVLSVEERRQLSIAMLKDVLNGLKKVSNYSIIILTNDEEVAKFALKEDCIVEKQKDNSLNISIKLLVQSLIGKGFESLLILPADIPTIDPHDIEQMINEHKNGITIVPSSIDCGTNAILITLPNVIDFQFGENSKKKHIAAAHNCRIKIEIKEFKSIVRDIDRPDDLSWLLSYPSQTRTVGYLKRSGIEKRMKTNNSYKKI